MKIECCSCKEEFEIPDGKGINRAICPFCGKPNDLRKPSFFRRSSKKESAVLDNVQKLSKSQTAKQNHPLAPQMWIMAICTLIITTIIVVNLVLTIIVFCIAAHELKPVLKEFEQSMDKNSRELQKSMDKTRDLQQSFNKLLQP